MINKLKGSQLTSLQQGELLEILLESQKQISNSAFLNWSDESFMQELQNCELLVYSDSSSESFSNELNKKPNSSPNNNPKYKAFILYRELDVFEIMVLATSVTCLRKGVMWKLLKELQNNAMHLKKSIYLEVHEKNTAAISLYIKAEFKISHQRKQYYADGANALILIWEKES